MASPRLSSIYKILNKKAIPYEIDGKSGTSYRVTVSQNDDADVLEEKVTKESGNRNSAIAGCAV